MFLSRNKRNNVYPCKPQFYHIKVGLKGIKIIKACFRDEKRFTESIVLFEIVNCFKMYVIKIKEERKEKKIEMKILK